MLFRVRWSNLAFQTRTSKPSLAGHSNKPDVLTNLKYVCSLNCGYVIGRFSKRLLSNGCSLFYRKKANCNIIYKIRIPLLCAMSIQVPLPVIIAKENKWYVASCPALDIATQGKTEKEVKENMADLINDYLNDPDTPKPTMEDLMSISLANIPVQIPEGVIHPKATAAITAKGN
jgi:predicted RNase H-like HicB family nuclease